jgi:hypothetical protein
MNGTFVGLDWLELWSTTTCWTYCRERSKILGLFVVVVVVAHGWLLRKNEKKEAFLVGAG